MHQAKQLLTSIELDEPAAVGRDDHRTMFISALLELELTTGRRVTLLDDRGWGCSGSDNIWAYTSQEELVETARTVVGPDEPFGGASYEDVEQDYWADMAATAAAQGVHIDADDLAALPHEVAISDQIQQRLARARR